MRWNRDSGVITSHVNVHHTRTGGVSARTTAWEMVLILPRIWGRTTVLRRSPASQRIRYRVNADEKRSGLRVRDYFDEISGWRIHTRRAWRSQELRLRIVSSSAIRFLNNLLTNSEPWMDKTERRIALFLYNNETSVRHRIEEVEISAINYQIIGIIRVEITAWIIYTYYVLNGNERIR